MSDQRAVMVGSRAVIVQTPGAINDQRGFLEADIADYIEAQAKEIEALREWLTYHNEDISRIKRSLTEALKQQP